jgi:hypothetical protein
VENGSWPTYAMHLILPPELGVTVGVVMDHDPNASSQNGMALNKFKFKNKKKQGLVLIRFDP